MRTFIRAGVIVGLAAGLLPASAFAAGTTTFIFTGTEQLYMVPAGVTSVSVVATGAPGGKGIDGTSGVGGSGGSGAVAAGELAVAPGETLYVEVGGVGIDGGFGGAGGFNGGGAGGFGGGGGGASDVRTCSIAAGSCPAAVVDSLHSRLLVAAGGGGGGSAYGTVSGGNGGAGGIVNGNDGVSGTSFKSGGGGRGATLAEGGNGGAAPDQMFCGETPQPGAGGGLGTGGASGTALVSQLSGGGGGAGYWGGGGGGAPCIGAAIPQPAEGGGGGGGSSYGPPGFTSGPASTTAPSVRIAPLAAPAVHTSATGLSFSGQPQGTPSAPQVVTVTNIGAGPLTVTGLDFTGTNPGDYYVSGSTCSAPIASGSSCQVSLRFAPLATGTRAASLRISSNDPAGPTLVGVTGTGTAAPQGPLGPAGKQGPAGKVELVSCKSVTRTLTKVINHKRRRVKVTQQKCSARIVSSPVKIKTTATDTTAAVSRAGVVYARGYRLASGRLVLTDVRRRLARGRYTLTLKTRHGRHTTTRRSTITLS